MLKKKQLYPNDAPAVSSINLLWTTSKYLPKCKGHIVLTNFSPNSTDCIFDEITFGECAVWFV